MILTFSDVDQFKYAGQNLAMSMTSEEAEKSPDDVANLAAGWFDEQKNGGAYGWMNMINKFTTVGEGYVIYCRLCFAIIIIVVFDLLQRQRCGPFHPVCLEQCTKNWLCSINESNIRGWNELECHLACMRLFIW